MKNNKKGFTLAELLVVVGIIAVLIAIAIPVFSAQLEKSREAVDAANIRAKYAEMMTTAATGGTVTDQTVTLNQTEAGWTIGAELKWPENLDVTASPAAGDNTATLTYSAATASTEAKITVTFSKVTN